MELSENQNMTSRKMKSDYDSAGNEENMSEKEQICPVAKKCGGCKWINKPYTEQLKAKPHVLKHSNH